MIATKTLLSLLIAWVVILDVYPCSAAEEQPETFAQSYEQGMKLFKRGLMSAEKWIVLFDAAYRIEQKIAILKDIQDYASAADAQELLPWLRGLASPELKLDSECRIEAVNCIGLIVMKHKLKTPIYFVNLADDPDSSVRHTTLNYLGYNLGLSAGYEPEVFPLFLRLTDSDDFFVCDRALCELTYAFPGKAETLAAVSKSLLHPDFGTRHNAYCYKFKLSNDLEQFTTHLLFSLSPKRTIPLFDKSRKNRHKVNGAFNCAFAACMRFQLASKQDADRFARVLLNHLSSEDPILCESAVRVIGVMGKYHSEFREAAEKLTIDQSLRTLSLGNNPEIRKQALRARQLLIKPLEKLPVVKNENAIWKLLWEEITGESLESYKSKDWQTGFLDPDFK